MEAKTNAFFALRERLYATAAAGCAIIKEDFRLQRAIEAFQPLSAANPVFAKLYGMCQKLTESEQPAMLLTECIALADAVAVTQSRFQDDTPAEAPEQAAPMPFKQVSWQQFQNANHLVEGSSEYILEYDHFWNAVQDPRLLCSYLKHTNAKSERANKLSMVFEHLYGKALLPLLEESIDLKNPKSSGQQIIYLQRLGGSDEDAFFKRLATDPETPQEVRLRAMRALAESEHALDYAQDLLAIYQTEKGKIKSSALKCLVFTNSPLADTVLQKLFAKQKDTNDSIATEGCTPLCMRYTEEHLQTLIPDKDDRSKDYRFYYSSFMLANKPDAAEMFLLLADLCASQGRTGEHTLQVMNEILIENLCRHKDPGYHTLIRTLHAKQPKLFFKPRLVSELITDPENAFVLLENETAAQVEDVFTVLSCIQKMPDQRWYITPNFGYRQDRIDYSTVVFDELPCSMISYFGSCLRMRTTIDNDLESKMCKFFEKIIDNCSDEIRPAVEAAIRKTMPLVPEKSNMPTIYFPLRCFTKAHGDAKGFIKKGLLISLEKHNHTLAYHQLTTLRQFVPLELLIADLREAAEIIPQKKLPADMEKTQLAEIARAIDVLTKED